jgi:hypothetical protein
LTPQNLVPQSARVNAPQSQRRRGAAGPQFFLTITLIATISGHGRYEDCRLNDQLNEAEQRAMAKGLALARVIGLKWPAAASDQATEAETVAKPARTGKVIDADPVHLSASDASAAVTDALSQALFDSAGQGTAIAAGDMRESVTNDAITAIEADIASLLASMNAVSESDAKGSDAKAADASGADETVDAEDATLTLLGELDRLWQADPMVGNASAA